MEGEGEGNMKGKKGTGPDSLCLCVISQMTTLFTALVRVS